MFTDLIEYPIESRKLKFNARQVLRDFDDKPHLLLRLKLEGTRFPQRALLPFVIANGELLAYHTEIAEDELSVRAYFDRPIPEGSRIEFGYGKQIYLRFPASFSMKGVDQLDRKKLPEKVQFLENFPMTETNR